jgi:hypothetical protein
MADAQLMHLDPPGEAAMLSAISSHALHMLAVQLPADTGGRRHSVPQNILALLHKSTIPVLVYPRRCVCTQYYAERR